MIMTKTRRHILIYTFLIILTVVFIFPFFWLFITAFKPHLVTFAIPPVWNFTPTFDNFRNVFIEGEYLTCLINSVIICTASVAIVMIIGTPAAYAFSRYNFRGKDDLTFFIITTRMGPSAVLVLPYYIIFDKFGLLDTHIALIIVYVTINLGLVIWLMKSFFDEIPKDLDDAALVDGYSRFYVFLKIVFPLAKSGFVTSAILSYIFVWNEFLYAFILTRFVAKTLPVIIPTYIGTMQLSWELMCAAGVMTIIPVMVFALLIQKHLVRGLSWGAVKT